MHRDLFPVAFGVSRVHVALCSRALHHDCFVTVRRQAFQARLRLLPQPVLAGRQADRRRCLRRPPQLHILRVFILRPGLWLSDNGRLFCSEVGAGPRPGFEFKGGQIKLRACVMFLRSIACIVSFEKPCLMPLLGPRGTPGPGDNPRRPISWFCVKLSGPCGTRP